MWGVVSVRGAGTVGGVGFTWLPPTTTPGISSMSALALTCASVSVWILSPRMESILVKISGSISVCQHRCFMPAAHDPLTVSLLANNDNGSVQVDGYVVHEVVLLVRR